MYSYYQSKSKSQHNVNSNDNGDDNNMNELQLLPLLKKKKKNNIWKPTMGVTSHPKRDDTVDVVNRGTKSEQRAV